MNDEKRIHYRKWIRKNIPHVISNNINYGKVVWDLKNISH